MKSSPPIKNLTLTKKELLTKNKVPDGFVTASGDRFEWSWLPNCKVMEVLRVRNAPHVISQLKHKSSITNNDHRIFLGSYDELHRIDFILIDASNKNYVGGINIVLTNNGYEIGKYIGDPFYLGRKIAYQMSIKFLDFVSENFKEIKEVRAVTRKDNYKNINLNFKLGFTIIKSISEDYWLMEKQ